MQTPDKFQFITHLDKAVSLIDEAAELGLNFSERGFTKLVFVGCGAPFRIMSTISYWVEKKCTQIKSYNYYPAEFIHQNPDFLDKHSLVILGSYSGTTPEIIEAAKYCQTKLCYSLGITRLADSPLSKEVDQTLLFGDTKLGDYSRFIVTSALVSGFCSNAEPLNWCLHSKLLGSLRKLPYALFSALEETEKKIKEFTQNFSSCDSMFVVRAGPMFRSAYLLAFNSFMEMQWMHVTPIQAAEFFHGPFELVDESFPVINFIDETPHRIEAERVKRFGEKYCNGFTNFDSKDYELEGIENEIRPFVSAIVLDAATRRLIDYFSEARNHERTTRRYMGKVDY